ncbi:MAG: DUF2141 domain-containing protein [Burkholderiales bacterium]|nr:DUF2141 domain-containing protein [Burkholderiales bacterium]
MNAAAKRISRLINLTATPLLAVGLLAGAMQSANAGSLTVDIKGDVLDKGTVMLALYKKDDKWMGKATDGRVIPAKKGGVSVTFDDVPEGEYAISMYVDENNNGKLDANGIGIPIEPYAFSNDASGAFGPPSFAQAKFVVGKEKTTHVINLK